MVDWPHAPVHKLSETGAYIVTAGTYGKIKYFHTPERLTIVQDTFFELAQKFKWQIQAWAILSNHYHFVAIAPEQPESLKHFLGLLHSLTSKEINKLDDCRGRKVWFQYWDSLITYERSYLARLNYVNQNPVRHGLVSDACDYGWCSAAWFERKSEASFVKTVKNFKIDRVNVIDDF